jgi:hypothetical protein
MDDNVIEKIKVMEKQRRSKEKRMTEESYSCS